jgi:hypothetical protein
MRSINRQLRNTPWVATGQGNVRRSSIGFQNIYTVLPADLVAADNEVLCAEQDWRSAGSPRVTGLQVDQALQTAKRREKDLKEAKVGSRRSLRLRYLDLVRLFVLTGLPRHGRGVVTGSCAAVVCALSLLLTPFLFSSLGSALLGALILALSGSSLVTASIFLLWPTERKRRSFQHLQQRLKECRDQVRVLRPAVAQAWASYKTLQEAWAVCDRLDKARQRRNELAALLASEKYKLVHTDWRALRGSDFENFLLRVFELLGYQVQKTGPPQQGVDLVVTGKGRSIAVEAKGYEGSVGNDAVMAVATGMNFYQCASCVVITNSRFTRAARDLAAVNGCRLIDGAQIPDLIEGRIF